MIVYTYERRKLPLTAALIVVPVILFFQPGKPAFRERYWRAKYRRWLFGTRCLLGRKLLEFMGRCDIRRNGGNAASS